MADVANNAHAHQASSSVTELTAYTHVRAPACANTCKQI